jgi:diguanylate cyclase (GGDEF)-like protein/PAS domain S-box-containing protein
MNDRSYLLLMLEDDDFDMELSMRALLKSDIKFVVKRAKNEEEYRELLEKFHPDLILSDFSLPQFDGLSALAAARNKYPEIPFIFVSGTIGEEHAIEVLSHGVTDYVLKHRIGRLVPAVMRALRETEERVEREKAQNEVLRLLKRNELILQCAGDGILGVDLKGTIIFINPMATQLLGYAMSGLVGKPVQFLLKQNNTNVNRETAVRSLQFAFFKGSGNQETFWRNDGTSFPAEYTGTPIIEDEKMIGTVITFRDITERLRNEEQLVYLAHYDPLSGLPNRNLLYERLMQAIANAKKLSNQFALIYLDIDRFKLINDSLGHNIGDFLLRNIAERLKTCLKTDDTLARPGGDEFIFVRSNINDESELTEFINEIFDTITSPVMLDGHQLCISASIGISLFPQHGEDGSTLLKNAEVAMYGAKKLGLRHQIYNHAMNTSTVERLTLESSLRRAMEQQELLFQYQPQVALASGKIVGAEALLRWQPAGQQIIPPTDFIGLAEETGIIIPWVEWLIQRACAQAKIWQSANLPIRVAVNVSARQFMQRNIVSLVEAALNESKLDPRYLELELTESAFMYDPDEVAELLYRLKDLGVYLAIDDFGTGYSNLSYLHRYPVDVIKIDQSFIKSIQPGNDEPALVKAIIALAHSLNLEVVAEGVETEHQIEVLHNLSCNIVQGFLFSGPVAAEQFSAMLEADKRLLIPGVPGHSAIGANLPPS